MEPKQQVGLSSSNSVKEAEVTDDSGTHEAQEESETVLATESLPSLGNGNKTALGSVTQPKKMRGIGFGDVFKDGFVKLRTRISSERKEKKTEKPLIIQ